MHRCLPCSEKESVSSRLDGGCPPAAPRSNSMLGPIRHDMQEYYDLRIIQMEIEGLTLTKCHDQEVHNLAMLEEVLIGI
jgi:hypothetical protein